MFITKLVKKTFGSRNERLLKHYQKTVLRINALESQMIGLSDAELSGKAAEFKDRI